MTNAQFLTQLLRRRDHLLAEYSRLLSQGGLFAASDLWPDVQFAIRAAHSALMGR